MQFLYSIRLIKFPMKVDVRDIPAEGLHLEISLDANELQTKAGGVDFFVLPPVSANLELLKSDGEIFVRGDISSVIKLKCARCLKEFEYKISSNIDIVYTREIGYYIKEKELTREEIGINYLKGDEIDIDSVLLEQISLDMPMQPLCNPDCRGVCPRCGADLNQGECGCPPVEAQKDQSFAKLKEVKIKP